MAADLCGLRCMQVMSGRFQEERKRENVEVNDNEGSAKDYQ
jgi:hypothetical protein